MKEIPNGWGFPYGVKYRQDNKKELQPPTITANNTTNSYIKHII
jgi:hypothetical protein